MAVPIPALTAGNNPNHKPEPVSDKNVHIL